MKKSNKTKSNNTRFITIIGGSNWDLLVSALAKMHAAFPAGEYGFDERQNLAMNALGDITSILSSEYPQLEREIKLENQNQFLWQIYRLVQIGLINKKTAKAAIADYNKRMKGEKHAPCKDKAKVEKQRIRR